MPWSTCVAESDSYRTSGVRAACRHNYSSGLVRIVLILKLLY